MIGAFMARSSAAAWRLFLVSVACTRRMRPSEMPSWSAWMIDRVKAASSGIDTRSAIFRSAFSRDSPIRISPSVSVNSSTSGPFMCSVSFEIAPSNPIPASTLTASRSSASGSSERICSFRLRAFIVTKVSGRTNPIAANTAMSNIPTAPDLSAEAARVAPTGIPAPANIALAAR